MDSSYLSTRWAAMKSIVSQFIDASTPKELVRVTLRPRPFPADRPLASLREAARSLLDIFHFDAGDLVSHSEGIGHSFSFTFSLSPESTVTLLAFSGNLEIEGRRSYALFTTFPLRWKVFFPVLMHPDFVRRATDQAIKDLLSLIAPENTLICWAAQEAPSLAEEKRRTGSIIAVFAE
jgi:hypothetical protein